MFSFLSHLFVYIFILYERCTQMTSLRDSNVSLYCIVQCIARCIVRCIVQCIALYCLVMYCIVLYCIVY